MMCMYRRLRLKASLIFELAPLPQRVVPSRIRAEQTEEERAIIDVEINAWRKNTPSKDTIQEFLMHEWENTKTCRRSLRQKGQ